MVADATTMTHAAIQSLAARVLKVDHAGENGAIHIYAAQITMARITAPQLVAELKEFKSHEERHREIFAAELNRRGVRRCHSYALCGFGGFVLGLITGLLGRRAICATTVAVERVVLRHLEHQLEQLREDRLAVQAIESIVHEEREHHDRSAAMAQEGQLWLKVLTPVVAASTEAVIWLGMKL
jgi:ubiquinone biosynthesis monooxygenase Coq7